MLVSTPELPSPCRWGWSKASEGHYEPFVHACLMQVSPAMNLFPTNVKRVVLSSVSSKKLPLTAQLSVTVKGIPKSS